MSARLYTSKQMGDACEMLVAAELTLAGVPAMKMPDNWPGYDVIAQPKDIPTPQRISVKSRTFKRGRDAYVEYNIKDESFDWLAIVLLPGEGQYKRRFFIVPKAVSDIRFYRYGPTTKNHDIMSGQVDKMAEFLQEFEDNFRLSATGTPRSN
jgi:hypothetical protein